MTTALQTTYRRSELEASDCLLRYRRIWIEGADDSSDYSLRGIGFHRVKHRYVDLLREHGLSSDAELATQAFIQGVALSKMPVHLIPELRRLWDFHAERFDLPLDKFIASEEKQESEGIRFAPDLVLGHPERNELEIVDDKTTYKPMTEAEAREDFQARLYVRFARAIWPGFSSYRFTFAWVRFGTVTSVVFQPAELDQIDKEIAAAIARIEQAKIDEAAGHPDPWPAIPGPSCAFCTLQCPVVDHAALIPKRLLGMQQATKAAELILAGERLIKTAKAALKAYVAANGPIDVNGVAFDNRPVIQRSYPADQVIAALQAANIVGAVEEADLTFSQSSLAKAFKRFPILEEQLGPLVREKKTYRFGTKQAGVDDAENDS